MDTSTNALRVAIIGGGIGGLSFAMALGKSGVDFDVDIYESAQCFSEVGAGIGMWPRVSHTLHDLGLEEDLAKYGSGKGEEPFSYFKADETPLISFGQTENSIKTYHRADFLKVLEDNIPKKYKTWFGKRLVSYEDGPVGPVALRFNDGTTATCDVLVGADGVKSAVRKAMFENLASAEADVAKAVFYKRCVEPTWCGLIMYRALIPTEDLKAASPDHFSLSTPRYFFGKHKSALTYPIQQGQKVNFAALSFKTGVQDTIFDGPWVSQVDEGELTELFNNWDPLLTILLKSVPSPLKWVVNEVRNLPTFVSGRVAMMGDAAHAMMPNLASGAGQAIEDAVILADVLSHSQTGKHSVQRALEVYNRIRRPHAQYIQRMSHDAGEAIWLNSPGMQKYSAEDSALGKIPRDELNMLMSAVLMGGKHLGAGATTMRGDRDIAKEKLNSWTEPSLNLGLQE